MPHKQAVRAIVIHENKILAMYRNKFGMEYYTLIGGGVNIGEDTETALRRELWEETSMKVGTIHLVFIEDGGDLYGVQNVFVCEYIGGEPMLHPESEEAMISALGQNIYKPVWLAVDQMNTVTFRSSSVRNAILSAVHNNFPDSPQMLAWKA